MIENQAFYIQDQIGEGNYATLTEVRPDPDSVHAAIPLVVKQPLKGKEAAESIAREINVYREVRASRYLPHFVAGDSKGIVLRYYPRTSIDRWFFSEHSEADTYSYADIQQWLSQLVDALLDLWEADFAHGDGKPGNILITGPTFAAAAEFDGNGAVHEGHNEFRLVDFGSSVRLNQRVPTYSPGYTPPDALQGRTYLATPLADIFSFLGGTLYYLVSGGVDPWFDQVADSVPTIPAGSGRKANRQWKDFTKRWIDANRTRPVTQLSALNENTPASVDALASIWLNPDPSRRLLNPAKPDGPSETWQINTSWQLENIRQRLHSQIEWMAQRLRDSGRDLGELQVVDSRHRLARNPEEVPDLTAEHQAPVTT